MSSPVGHSLAGYVGYKLLPILGLPVQSRRVLLGAIALANLPDLDFVPGLVLGNLRAFHRQASHSLLCAVLVGLAVALISWLMGRQRQLETGPLPPKATWARWGFWAMTGYLGHLGLDTLVSDKLGPAGLQLLWPFSGAFLISPITILPGLRFDQVISWENAQAVGVEILLLGSLAIAVTAIAATFARQTLASESPSDRRPNLR